MSPVGHHRLSAIDLCSGCGGLSLGLRAAGFDVIAAVENDALAAATYTKNHPGTIMVEKDIRSVDPNSLMGERQLKPGQLDLLAGCPPCQGFSSLRTRNGNKVVIDPKNDLIFEFFRFVRAFLPKAVMIENVPALLQDHRLSKFRADLALLDYDSNAELFDAQDFGVPQRRKRMVLFCWRADPIPFAYAGVVKPTVAQTIRHLGTPQDSRDPTHNYLVRRSKRIRTLIRHIPKNGGSRADLPADQQLGCHQRINGFRDVYGRMAWDKPAPTITGGCINPSKGRFLHPEEHRAITLREAALLQGFPRGYEFDMSKGRYAVAQMIGNALPPAFAERHARSIARHLGQAR